MSMISGALNLVKEYIPKFDGMVHKKIIIDPQNINTNDQREGMLQLRNIERIADDVFCAMRFVDDKECKDYAPGKGKVSAVDVKVRSEGYLSGGTLKYNPETNAPESFDVQGKGLGLKWWDNSRMSNFRFNDDGNNKTYTWEQKGITSNYIINNKTGLITWTEDYPKR